jgi:pantothenate kinase-related protein Tda10
VPAEVTVQLNNAQRTALQAFCGTPATCVADKPLLARQRPSPESNTGSEPYLQLVQGPPGTGKTTLIAAIVQWLTGGSSRTSANSGLYIVAHSNVAVKRVAEKLESVGFLGFKLVVSDEFYFEWCVPTAIY